MRVPTLNVRSPALLPLCLVPLLALLVACGGSGGGSSPTDPPSPTVPGSAAVEGQVSVAGGASGSLVLTGSGLTSMAGADSTGAGVTVRVQGTSLATTADAGGRFNLAGVPPGNQVLVFETSQGSAGVVVEDVRPSERIRMSVRVAGGTAEVTELDRDGGDSGAAPEDDGEDAALDLSLELSPDTWNLNYDHSSGTVAAFIRGQGFRRVILDSIVLLGDDPAAAPLEPVGASRQGNHVRARFAKNELLDLLDEPAKGSVHLVVLQFEVDGEEALQELTAEVRIVGPEDEEDGGEDDEEELGDLSLQLSPDTWNLNYDRASGHVTAFIRGTGLGAIDTDSVELVGDDPGAEPLPASFARLEGSHVRAQFPRSEVLGLLDAPGKNTTHTVLVRFTSGGGAGSHELETRVRVVGNDK